MAEHQAATTPPPPARLLPVAVLLWLAGIYLRIPVLVAPPLAPFISNELALTQALTGALTTLPILMLAIGAMPGSLAIARIGPRNTLALAMVIMVIGSAGRALVPDTLTLMLASAVMGFGVAMMQPALPALLPRWLEPHHLALGSAIYMNGMLMGEFISAGMTLPVLMPLFDNSWRATLLAWSLPALLVAAALYLPKREQAKPVGKVAWLPDWSNPLTLKIGLLLGLSGSMFFGLNAYMGNLLEQQGQFGKLSDALFWFNLAQVLASLIMLKMARAWVGRRSTIIVTAALSILGALGAITVTGWWSIVSATLMSLTSGILLILLVAVPPLVTISQETGRLSADWTGDARHAILTIIAYSLLVLPWAFTLDLKHSPEADPLKAENGVR